MNQDKPERRAGIIGGGIAGLAVATALAQRGWLVDVYEQADAIREVGAGLQISPNGVAVLTALGQGAALADCARQSRAVKLRDKRGAIVLNMDFPDGTAAPFYLLHRADLVELLKNSARQAGATINLGAKITAKSGVNCEVVFDGLPRAYDLVIGADGVHSTLRQALNPQQDAFFTRQVAWRAIVPNVINHPDEAQVHMAPGCHIVTYPLRDGTAVNMVAIQERADWVEDNWQLRGDPKQMRKVFAGFSDDIEQLLSELSAVNIWGLMRRPVARKWVREGVAILGDAAHPTLPFLAQGANLALEDAYVLAACLDEFPDQNTGLAQYEKIRRPRAARVIEAANKNAWKYHLRNPLLRFGAHSALRGISVIAPNAMLRQYSWLYDYDVTASQKP